MDEVNVNVDYMSVQYVFFNYSHKSLRTLITPVRLQKVLELTLDVGVH